MENTEGTDDGTIRKTTERDQTDGNSHKTHGNGREQAGMSQYFTLPPLVRGVRKQSEYSPRSPRTVRAESEHYYSNSIFYSAWTLLGLCLDFVRTLLGIC